VQDTITTLRHETLAHFGINLLAPGDKATLLADITAVKDNLVIDEAGYMNQVAATPSLMSCRLRAPNLHMPETKRELAREIYHELMKREIRTLKPNELIKITQTWVLGK
jgi:hypothetical protein